MTRHLMGITILVGAAFLSFGCDNSAPPPAAQATADAAKQAAIDAKNTADAKVAADLKAADATKVAADQAAVAAKTVADAKSAANLKMATDQATADAKAATDAKTAADAKTAMDLKTATDAQVAADANTAKATSLLEQLVQYVKDNKVELADKTLAQLDGMKGSLPTALQAKIENARTALNAQKTAAMLMK